MSIIARLQQFYLGYYGRPADPGGLAYWIEQANGIYLNRDHALAAAFGSTDQAEFRNLYSDARYIERFIDEVYGNLFGRQAEIQGLLFFKQEYDNYLAQGVSADQARAYLVARIIDGASGSDRIAINNKVSVAIVVTDELKLKSAAISEPDLEEVRDYFAGTGDDAWRLMASNRASELVSSIQANDSVADFMNVSVTSERGIIPMSEPAARLFYSRGFLLEGDNNEGRVAGSIQINLQGGKFSGTSGDSLGTVALVPAGLTAKLMKLSDTEAQLTFTGAATTHNFSNSVSNVAIQFRDSDFQNLVATEVEGYSKSNIGIGFIDAAITVSDGLVRGTGSIANDLGINLNTDTLTIGSVTGRPIFGSLDEASGVDLSRTAGPADSGFSVVFVGDAASNSYSASYVGDSVRALGGNDTLTAGIGLDTFIFEASASANGVDTIKDFDIAGGDILDFSRFLNITGTGLVATQSANSEQVEWANGDVLVYQGAAMGAAIVEEVDLVALFDQTGSDTAAPFSYAQSDGKAVVITSASDGDAKIWYLVKNSNATSTFSADRNVVLESEVTLVGTLEGINNLTLSPFAAANFL